MIEIELKVFYTSMCIYRNIIIYDAKVLSEMKNMTHVFRLTESLYWSILGSENFIHV